MKRTLRASYTVEASVLMPIVLLIVCVIIERGISMYQSAIKDFRNKDELCQTKAVEMMYRVEMAEDIWEELGWK